MSSDDGVRIGLPTSLDVAGGVNNTGSGTSGTNINSNVVVLMRVQIVVRTYRHSEQKFERRGVA